MSMDPGIDSKVTLVNPSGTCGEDIVLTLLKDDPSNTFLYLNQDSSAKALYTAVSGWDGRHNVTNVQNSSGEEIASLEWHDSLGDEVTLPQNAETGGKRKTIKLSRWMSGGIFQSTIRSFQDQHKRKYQWESYAPYCNLILHAKDHPQGPIAHFRRSHRVSSSSDSTNMVPATLMLTPRAQEIQDTVVISCLFLERNRRSNVEKTFTAKEDVHRMGGDASGSLAMTGLGAPGGPL